MFQFVKNTFIFLLLPALYFAINSAYNYSIYRDIQLELKTSDLLVIGDSHTQKGINPKFINDTQNISQIAEPYILTLWKLRKVIKEVKPKQVIIGFAPHNISEFNDDKFTNDYMSDELFKRCYTFDDFKKMLTKLQLTQFDYYKYLWKKTGFYPYGKHVHFIGRYNNIKKSNLANLDLTLKKHYYLDSEELGISDLSVSALDTMISECLAQNIEPILISCPVNQAYYKSIPSKFKEKFQFIKQKYKAQNIRIFDCQKSDYPDSLFLDIDHLNSMGAKLFTNEISDLILRE